jgi:hypothetical protein
LKSHDFKPWQNYCPNYFIIYDPIIGTCKYKYHKIYIPFLKHKNKKSENITQMAEIEVDEIVNVKRTDGTFSEAKVVAIGKEYFEVEWKLNDSSFRRRCEPSHVFKMTQKMKLWSFLKSIVNSKKGSSLIALLILITFVGICWDVINDHINLQKVSKL